MPFDSPCPCFQTGLQSIGLFWLVNESSMKIKMVLAIDIILVVVSACGMRPSATTSVPVASAVATPIHVASVVETPTQTPTLTDTPIPPPPDLPLAPAPVLVRIDFQDANHGWGIASNGSGSILRTVDGGLTWLNATPPGGTGIGYSTGFFALSINVAWVLVPNVDFYTGNLFHTTDGGSTWTTIPVPVGEADIQFLDDNTGRILANRGAGAGSNAVEMYQTSDGGTTWISAFHNNPTQTGSSSSLPLGGIKNGMVFIDANTGWVTGSRPVDGDVYLFITHDGGVSWAQQTISLPSVLMTNQFLVGAPSFFGQDGYLPISIRSANTVLQTFYVTHDGGITWEGDPTNGQKILPSPGAYSFADAANGFDWNGGSDLFYTIDSASHWTSLKPNLDLSGRLTQLEFVPGQTGKFTGWALTSVDDSGHSQLYQTDDSGANWKPLIP